MNDLVPALQESLFSSAFENIGSDLLEIGIDSILHDGLLKDIPIVSTILGAGKVAQNVHDRNLAKQTAVFVNTFRTQGIISTEIEKHVEKLLNNSKLLEQELGRVLIMLNENIDVVKSVYEAKFYAAFVKQHILWEDFCELCDITKRLFVSDIRKLKEAFINGGVKDGMKLTYQYERLISVGLLTNEARLSGGGIFIDMDDTEPTMLLELSPVGEMFCNIIWK